MVAREVNSDYFQKLSASKNIRTVALYINSHFNVSMENIIWPLGKHYSVSFPCTSHFPFTIEKGACQIFMNRGFYKNTVNLIQRGTCEARSNLSIGLIPIDEHDSQFGQEYLRMLNHWERVYIHIIEQARVS